VTDEPEPPAEEPDEEKPPARRPFIAAVIGPGDVGRDSKEYDDAQIAGRILARGGAVVVTGGLGGVMEAACRGARESGGATLGLLPEGDRSRANEWVTHCLATGTGHARNFVVASADVVVAIAPSRGTFTEMWYATVLARPVVTVGRWVVDEEFRSYVHDEPDAAAAAAWAVDEARSRHA
jgi:uncharacterized protein (TIGR00725 family)